MPPRHFDGRRVRSRRRAVDLTQSQVAEALNVGGPAVASWETGHSAPDEEKLPALARALGQELDVLFPRDGLPDLVDVRCDAGFAQYETAALIGTKSAVPVANAERGRRRLSEGFVQPLAHAYGVSVEELLAAQERSFGNEVPAPETPAGRSSEVPQSLAEKITYLLDHSYPGDKTPPTDTEIARGVNQHAGAQVVSEADIRRVRTGAEPTVSPVVSEGLAEVFGVSALYFEADSGDAAARQVMEALRFLASVRQGAVTQAAARGHGVLSDDALAFVNDLVAELQERDLPGSSRTE